eukprot:TRINITY_DN5789_c0_g1_i10.p1 TRINITY_DN5789_c0_g1~~TRINITY_DN5789_c0_g1_i10.p1  ORF type:complete len:534 (+),score=88.53 TRINITY_DN5789_c0_g1_i10:34-1635(+)
MIKNESFESKDEELEKLIHEGHESHLLAYFAQEKSSRDCIIQSQDGYFLCHKLILAATNSFFKEILRSLDSEETAFVLMLDFQVHEVLELITTAYKHNFETSELKKLFFTENKPPQLEELSAERFQTRKDILEYLKLHKDRETKSAEFFKVETIVVKEESASHDDLFVDNVESKFFLDEEPLTQDGKKRKKRKLKDPNSKPQKKKKRIKKNEAKEEKESVNPFDYLEHSLPDLERKENVDSTQEDKEGDIKKKRYPIIPSSAYPLPCPHCGKILKDNRMRCKHRKECLAQSSKIGCNICHRCGATFAFSEALERHLSINCENSCKICFQVFVSRNAVKEHMLYSHGEVAAHTPQKKPSGEFTCTQCGKVYTRKDSLNVHLRNVHQIPGVEKNVTYQCNECGKTLCNEQSLIRHMSLHKPPEFPCPICGKLFHTKRYMNLHTKRTHAQPQDLKFKCDVCNKGFNERDKMESHKNIHLNVKPYKCRWCERAFKDDSNRRAHERTSHAAEYMANKTNVHKRIQVQKSEPASDMDSE